MATKTAKRTKIICPTCKGNGFYSVPYHQAEEEVHVQCEDCDRQGEIYIDDDYTPTELREKGVI